MSSVMVKRGPPRANAVMRIGPRRTASDVERACFHVMSVSQDAEKGDWSREAGGTPALPGGRRLPGRCLAVGGGGVGVGCGVGVVGFVDWPR